MLNISMSDTDISMSDTKLLQFAIENGMIDTALLQEKIEMQKREEYLTCNKQEFSHLFRWRDELQNCKIY